MGFLPAQDPLLTESGVLVEVQVTGSCAHNQDLCALHQAQPHKHPPVAGMLLIQNPKLQLLESWFLVCTLPPCILEQAGHQDEEVCLAFSQASILQFGRVVEL